MPEDNPTDSISVSLSDVISVLPPALSGPVPEQGWPMAMAAAIATANGGGGGGGGQGGVSADDAPGRQFELFERAPSGELLQILSALLPGGDASAARAIAFACAAIERALWGLEGGTLAELDVKAEEGIAADLTLLEESEKALAATPALVRVKSVGGESAVLTERGCLLVRLRLSRRRLLASLRRTLLEAAETCDTDSAAGAAALAALGTSVQEPPPMYPAFDDLPVEELAGWESREWDWQQRGWA